MSVVIISQSAAGQSVSVTLSRQPVGKKRKRAVLLSTSGARLRTYALITGHNELPMQDFGPGTYSLCVEAGEDVTVQQIIIS